MVSKDRRRVASLASEEGTQKLVGGKIHIRIQSAKDRVRGKLRRETYYVVEE